MQTLVHTFQYLLPSSTYSTKYSQQVGLHVVHVGTYQQVHQYQTLLLLLVHTCSTSATVVRSYQKQLPSRYVHAGLLVPRQAYVLNCFGYQYQYMYGTGSRPTVVLLVLQQSTGSLRSSTRTCTALLYLEYYQSTCTYVLPQLPRQQQQNILNHQRKSEIASFQDYVTVPVHVQRTSHRKAATDRLESTTVLSTVARVPVLVVEYCSTFYMYYYLRRGTQYLHGTTCRGLSTVLDLRTHSTTYRRYMQQDLLRSREYRYSTMQSYVRLASTSTSSTTYMQQYYQTRLLVVRSRSRVAINK